MNPERRRDVDRLFRATFGRLIHSVLAHGKSASGEPSEPSASEPAVDITENSTVTSSASVIPPEFEPGKVMAQRYRIVHLLGRGGMGAVYRADDLLLGQPVALKFLPTAATASPSALSRFRNEVRTARQVSHPNVCRVYDIGEADGLMYLSMEYVDGEDLASLLRRIGRFPQDKALEIARQLCAGLAAAHDRGVIHRDLKPANIMLDGKGHVRITDFGLAGVAEHIRDLRSGTPPYMSPEQVSGKGVTLKSDVYALGIVMHELFTGKRRSREIKSAELDPVVERVIRRCLDEDPEMRPARALSVAAALPGGDPLAAALAAGETPSPEVVANAGAIEGLRIPVAVACMAAVIAGLAALCVLRQRHDIINQIPMENSPEVLAAKGREIAKLLGYTGRPVDTAFGWDYANYLRYAREKKDSSARQARTNWPSAIYFWYRESPHYLVSPTGPVTRSEPHKFELGMLGAVLDSEGRLVELHAHPWTKPSNQGHMHASPWHLLFAAAGLDAGRFTPAEPVLASEGAYDTRVAWTGSSDNARHDTLRVEAAAYQGQVVLFQIVGPWSRPDQSAPLPLGGFTFSTLLLFAIVLPIVAGLLAWRNDRIGRGDRRGAFRLACLAFVCVLLANLFERHHVPTFAEVAVLFSSLPDAVLMAAVFWVLYMALEPYVRRRLPGALISWSRLLTGQLRDPLVGADLAKGIVLGIAGLCVVSPLTSPLIAELAPQLKPSAGGFFSLWSWQLVIAVGAGLSYMFLLTLILLLVRRQWLAAPLFVVVLLLVAAPVAGVGFTPLAERRVFLFCLIWFALTRFGVLTAAALLYVHAVATAFPLTTNLSVWYADSALLAISTILALAIYAFHITLAGRPLWRDTLHEWDRPGC